MSEKKTNIFMRLFRSFLPKDSGEGEEPAGEKTAQDNERAGEKDPRGDEGSGDLSLQEDLFSAAELACDEELIRAEDPGKCFATADMLNNAALGALERGMEKEADRLWEAALLKEPGHVDALFNRTVFRLRGGRITPKEAYLELREAGPSGREDALTALAGECGLVPDEVQETRYMFHFRDCEMLHITADREEILFLSNINQTTHVLRYHRISGDKLGAADTGLRLEGEDIRCGAFRPHSTCYGAVFGNETLAFFDYEKKTVAGSLSRLGLHRRTIGEFTRLNFSRDGQFAAVSEPSYSDRRHPHTVFISIPDMRVIADLDLQFVCMPRRGGCLVRGRTDTVNAYTADAMKPGEGNPDPGKKDPESPDMLKRDEMKPGQIKPAAEKEDTAGPDAGKAVGGKAGTKKGMKTESLFLVEEDGTIREVFRFEEGLDKIREFDQLPAPFLGYSYKKSGECFLIDEDYRKVTLTKEIFKETDRTVFYDPDRARLYTAASRSALSLWDTGTRDRIFTYEYSGIHWDDPRRRDIPYPTCIAGALRREDGWEISAAFYDRLSGYTWNNFVLPDWQPPRRAAWRISRIPEETELEGARRKEEKLREWFYACRQTGNIAGAWVAYSKYREIPGIYGTGEQARMEFLMDLSAGKKSVHRIRPRGKLSQLPLFAVGNGIESGIGKNGVIGLCRSTSIGFTAMIFEPDGKLLNQVFLTGRIHFAAVRGEHIFGFCYGQECLYMDLRGKAVPLPWEDWPQEYTYYDMSSDGKLLLYLERNYSTVPRFAEIRTKNLDTGMETVMQISNSSDKMKFINSRTVACKKKDGRGGVIIYDALTGREKTILFKEYCLDYAVDRERELLVACAEDYNGRAGKRTLWKVFDADGRLLKEQEEDCERVDERFVLIPRSDLVVYVAKKERSPVEKYVLRIRNLQNGQILFEEAVREDSKPFVRPDGRAVYAVYKDTVSAWILEWDYET